MTTPHKNLRPLDEVEKEEVFSSYASGESMASIYRRTGVTPHRQRRELEREGLFRPARATVTETVERLERSGVDRDMIVEWYCTQNMPFVKVHEKLSEHVDLTERMTERVLRLLGVRKTVEQLRQRQGESSRSELQSRLTLLEDCGLSLHRLNELRRNGASNIELVELVNSRLDEIVFTVRWFEKHLRPVGPNLSWGENWLRTVVERFTEPDETVVWNDRSLIAPYELDVHLPDRGLALEYNGVYWHSDPVVQFNHGMTAVDYHRTKKELCRREGVTLGFVWEGEENQETVECFIKTGELPETLRRLG